MDFFKDHAVLFALICALVAVAYGIYLTWWLLRQPAGNERMQEIQRAVQEGAAAYLRKQYSTIAVVAIVPFLLLGFYNKLGWGTAIGFLVGAILSASADTLQQLQDGPIREPDLNDRASSETDWGIELRTRDRQRKLIAKIDSALRRIEEGEYGFCEVTGEPIGLGRLIARPIATMTVEAQQAHERREKISRDD